MKKIIVASNNQHKIKEIKEILSSFPLEVLSLKDAGINTDVEETGTTFMENAFIKAMEIYHIGKEYWVLADDSGLSVDALGGAPGVYSARFAGDHGNDKKNNEKLLQMMQGKPYAERRAAFVCAMVLVMDENHVIKVQGEAEGYITEKEQGNNNFGYDPVFYVEQYGKTFAELEGAVKNSISHRGKALEKLKKEMKKSLQGEDLC